jgi:hypothetical protein
MIGKDHIHSRCCMKKALLASLDRLSRLCRVHGYMLASEGAIPSYKSKVIYLMYIKNLQSKLA